MSFKCTRCSYFWTHGVVVPAEIYRNATGTQDKKTWRWREIREAVSNRDPARKPSSRGDMT